MKRLITIGILVVFLATIFLPGTASAVRVLPAPRIEKVPYALQPQDEHTRALLIEQGMSPEYVRLEKNYGKRSEGKSPYSREYVDLVSGNRILETQGLPMCDADGVLVIPQWEFTGGVYKEKNNVFKIMVRDASGKITIQTKNAQPDGRRANDKLSFDPQIFLNGVRLPDPSPVLLPVDPLNPNYQNNTLEWDYGICKRRIRLIEGMMLGSWVFNQNPNGDVRIVYNQSGDFRLKLGQYAIDADTEFIPKAVFNSASYPFVVSDDETFYPDAHPETSSVDGTVAHVNASGITWSEIRNGAGNSRLDDFTGTTIKLESHSSTANYWTALQRGIFLFDTSALPVVAIVTAATLSLYGYGKSDGLGASPNVNIYLSTPASNTALANADYTQVGTVAQSTPIAYAGWSTSYNNFALNDMTKISKTEVSKFGVRNANYDVADVEPAWSADKSSYFLIRTSEYGNGYKPKLVVTYSILTITTSAATLVEATTARLNGNVTGTGGDDPTVTVYWGTSDGGQVPGSWANNSAPTSPSQPQGVAAFYKDVTGLPTGTTIYFSAKATNLGGTEWGNTRSFLTKPAPPTSVSATDGAHTDKVTVTWTKSTGATGYRVYRNGGDISGLLGDVATYNDTTAPAGTITPGTADASDYTSPAYVTLTLSGHSTSNGVEGTYKVIAVNASGNSGDSNTDTGYRSVGALAYQWQRSAADSDADYSNISGGTTNPYNDTDAPADGSGRYFRCVLTASGATQQTSTADRGARAAPPSVTTSEATGTGETITTFVGEITAVNGANASTRGFEWDTDSCEPYANSWSAAPGSYDVGEFSRQITSLTKGELYYFRAFATNTYGTGYGSERTVLTKPDLPSSFVATKISTTQIDLAWVKGAGAQNTYIVRKIDNYPTNRADGVNVYNNTGVNYSDMGVISGRIYYYRAWSYATEGGLEQYSDYYAEDYESTGYNLIIWFQPVTIISDTTLPDREGPAQDGTINWGANPAGVTSELISFSPVTQSKPVSFSFAGAGAILTGTPTPIPEMYTELTDEGFQRVPGADAVNEILDASEVPRALWWYPVLYFGLGILALIAYDVTTKSVRGGVIQDSSQDGSLLIMCIITEVGFAVLGIIGLTPFWPAILFPIPAAALMISKKQFSW